MASCLGISTESNLIKYAKVSKERDEYKIDSFGVKFFDNIEEAVKQIIVETQSEEIPINMNLTDEIYNKFEVFNGLKKKDIESILSSELELLCEDKGENFKTLTSKYILSSTPLNKEKTTALYVSANKADIAGKLQKFKEHKINNLIPIPIALFNLVSSKKENTAIINIDDKTTVTTIINGEITDVHVLEIGMKQILDKISKKENSYARAYEACKNTTIYTMNVIDSQAGDNEYLQDIMPNLYEIIKQVKEIFDTNFISMQKILLSGTATIINNIELYFQEYFLNARCEILSPTPLVNKNDNINFKEYVEVNSAIALARQELGDGIQETNFKNIYSKEGFWEKIKRIGNQDISLTKGKTNPTKINLDLSFKGNLDRIEKDMIRVAATFLIVIIVYIAISVGLTNSINKKINEADEAMNNTQTVIQKVNEDDTKVKEKTSQYSGRMKKLEELNNQIQIEYKYKRAIPNLLSQIMSVIPKEVQLTSIENISEDKITIKAQAGKYEELGYFAAKLKTQGILMNVTFTPGVRENNIVKIDIEGNLP